MPRNGRCASPTCCATRTTPSTAATTGSPPPFRLLLLRGIAIGRRRDTLRDGTLAQYRANLDPRFDAVLALPRCGEAAEKLRRRIARDHEHLFVLVTNREVPATNNVSERALRPSVIFRKVTNGFRSEWGAQTCAAFRSVVSTTNSTNAPSSKTCAACSIPRQLQRPPQGWGEQLPVIRFPAQACQRRRPGSLGIELRRRSMERYRPGLPVRERAQGLLRDRDVGTRARRVEGGLRCVAASFAVGPRCGGRGTADASNDTTIDIARLRAWNRQGRKVSIRYVDEAGNVSQRTVWPFLIGYLINMRVMAAWCELRQDFRMFRTDRLQAIISPDERYSARRVTLRRRWLAIKDARKTNKNKTKI